MAMSYIRCFCAYIIFQSQEAENQNIETNKNPQLWVIEILKLWHMFQVGRMLCFGTNQYKRAAVNQRDFIIQLNGTILKYATALLL